MQDAPTASKEVRCRSRGNDGTGRPEITWSTARSRGRRGSRQVADVALDDLEIGQLAEPLAEQPGEVGVAFDDDDPAFRAGPLGDHPGDRPGAGTELDERPALSQSMLRTVVRDSQRLLGATLAMAVPCLRNLPRKSVKSFIESCATVCAGAAERGRRRKTDCGRLDLRNRSGGEAGRNRLELVAQELRDQLVDQPGLLDLGAWPHLGITTWRPGGSARPPRIEPGTSESTRSSAPQITEHGCETSGRSGADRMADCASQVRSTPFFHRRSWNLRWIASTSSSLAKWPR